MARQARKNTNLVENVIEINNRFHTYTTYINKNMWRLCSRGPRATAQCIHALRRHCILGVSILILFPHFFLLNFDIVETNVFLVFQI